MIQSYYVSLYSHIWEGSFWCTADRRTLSSCICEIESCRNLSYSWIPMCIYLQLNIHLSPLGHELFLDLDYCDRSAVNTRVKIPFWMFLGSCGLCKEVGFLSHIKAQLLFSTKVEQDDVLTNSGCNFFPHLSSNRTDAIFYDNCHITCVRWYLIAMLIYVSE